MIAPDRPTANEPETSTPTPNETATGASALVRRVRCLVPRMADLPRLDPSRPDRLTADGYRVGALEAARMATLLRRPVTAEGRALVRELVELTLLHEARRTRAYRADALRSLEATVAALAADLLVGWLNMKAAEGFIYRATDNREFSETRASSRHFDKLVGVRSADDDWQPGLWVELGLVEQTDPYVVERGQRSRRYRLTSKGLDITREHGITPETAARHFRATFDRSRHVVVRKAKVWDGSGQAQGKLIDRKNMPQTEALERNVALVREINTLSAGHEVVLGSVVLPSPYYVRSFGNGDRPGFDYDAGGRFICKSEINPQSMSGEARSRLLIDGEPVVELDVAACNLAIYYGMRGQQLGHDLDPYDLGILDRDVTKALIVAVLSLGRWPNQWPDTLREEHEKRMGRALGQAEFDMAKAAILARHPILANLDSSGIDWGVLQFREAEAMGAAMLDLLRRGVGVIPVHDSLIVPRSQEAAAREAMTRAFERECAFTPLLKIKGT